ncbi:MAG: multidrug resistance efflux transporter family protein, partial [Solibacillus isronensis]
TEVLFAMVGEMILLSVPLPQPIALIGLAVIIIGMLLHSYHTVLMNKRLQAANEKG